jgi:hypothetical protein
MQGSEHAWLRQIRRPASAVISLATFLSQKQNVTMLITLELLPTIPPNFGRHIGK